MEKKKINLVCIFLMLLFVFAIYDYGVEIVKSVGDSLSHAREMKGQEKVHVMLLPDNGFQFTDVLNGASPAGLLYQMRELQLAVPESDKYKVISTTLLLVITPLLLLLLFWAPYSFVRFIQDVKKEQIFIRMNVKRLRIIGVLFLFLGITIHVMDALDYFFLLRDMDIRIPGYEVVKFSFHYKSLIVGFLFFLFAEIFSLGVRMKEEQDLTV